MKRWLVKHENGSEEIEAAVLSLGSDGELYFWKELVGQTLIAVYAPKCWWSVKEVAS